MSNSDHEDAFDRIVRLLRAHPPRRRPLVDALPLREAAVLVPLFEKEGSLHLLLTRRTNSVRSHRGQVSFPGGARDAADSDLVATALREAEEEVGVRAADVRILGVLDDDRTPTGFRITPHVARIPWPYPFRASHVEVERIIEAPLAAFLRERHTHSRRLAALDLVGRILGFPVYRVEGETVWGATARIVRRLLDLIEADDAGGRATCTD